MGFMLKCIFQYRIQFSFNQIIEFKMKFNQTVTGNPNIKYDNQYLVSYF